MRVAESKTCTSCRAVKPLENFSKDMQKIDLKCSQCKACQKVKQSVYKAKNIEAARKTTREWGRRNIKYRSKREVERRAKCLSLRISHNFSTRVRQCLRGAKGGHRWTELVGYTPEELTNHLERQFTRGMAWSNYGKWHIDHVIPLASFDMSKPGDEAFRRAWHLSNLRPIWAAENLRKGDRLELLL